MSNLQKATLVITWIVIVIGLYLGSRYTIGAGLFVQMGLLDVR